MLSKKDIVVSTACLGYPATQASKMPGWPD